MLNASFCHCIIECKVMFLWEKKKHQKNKNKNKNAETKYTIPQPNKPFTSLQFFFLQLNLKTSITV